MKSIASYNTGTFRKDGKPFLAIGYFDGRLGCAFSMPAKLNGYKMPSLKECAAILAGESVEEAMVKCNQSRNYVEEFDDSGVNAGKLITSHTDGAYRLELFVAANGAHSIRRDGVVACFGMDEALAYQQFGVWIGHSMHELAVLSGLKR